MTQKQTKEVSSGSVPVTLPSITVACLETKFEKKEKIFRSTDFIAIEATLSY